MNTRNIYHLITLSTYIVLFVFSESGKWNFTLRVLRDHHERVNSTLECGKPFLMQRGVHVDVTPRFATDIASFTHRRDLGSYNPRWGPQGRGCSVMPSAEGEATSSSPHWSFTPGARHHEPRPQNPTMRETGV